MPAVYILQSTTTQKFYVGSAVDLSARSAEHHRGHSPYTRSRGPWVLVYQEEFATLAEARRRELPVKVLEVTSLNRATHSASLWLERPGLPGRSGVRVSSCLPYLLAARRLHPAKYDHPEGHETDRFSVSPSSARSGPFPSLLAFLYEVIHVRRWPDLKNVAIGQRRMLADELYSMIHVPRLKDQNAAE